MNHFIPIPFFLIGVIIYIVSNERSLKSFKLFAKVVIAISVIVFIYQYAKYLGYDIIEIVRSKVDAFIKL